MTQEKTAKWLVVVSLAWTCSIASASVIYDFENLTAGSFLNGQDGWTRFNALFTNTVVSTTPSHTNTTKVAQGEGRYYRANDTNYSFPAHSASGTAAEMQYDVKPGVFANGDDTYFALGKFAGSYDVTRVGPNFGFFQSGGIGKFSIRQPNFGTFIVGNLAATDAATDWYRLRLRVNFTANSGNGSGTLFVRNLTDGETSWRTVISGANLGILSMAADAQDPATWNAMFIHGQSQAAGFQSQFDNLIPIPEPASALLLGMSGLLFWRRRGK